MLKDLINTVTMIDAIVKIVQWSSVLYNWYIDWFKSGLDEFERDYAIYLEALKKMLRAPEATESRISFGTVKTAFRDLS